MSARTEIAPSTLGVERTEDAVAVTYLDGRYAVYRSEPELVDSQVRCSPGTDVQVLVTDESGTEGVMTYVNDRRSHDEILESTGVGRVLLEPGETEELFPGVTVKSEQHTVVIEADTTVANGDIYVFEDSDRGESAYKFE